MHDISFSPKIAIVGRGNVASHLIKAFDGKINVYSVNPHILSEIEDDTEIVLICIKDDAISSIMAELPESIPVVAHTAGSVDIDVLRRRKGYGVFYPLQTFTSGVDLNYSEIPIFIEGNNTFSTQLLTKIAKTISRNVYKADSEKRKKIHLASVFACNFSNAMVGIGQSILQENDIDPSVIVPLFNQTAAKLNVLSAKNAQTGPARRGDISVINEHLSMLADNSLLSDIYKNISRYISATAEDIPANK